MQLSTSLNLRQKQSLVMTPQLQQAIRLLQMTNLDLRQYLETECADNPFLEIEGEENNSQPDSTDTVDQTSDDRSDLGTTNEIDNALSDGTAMLDDPTKNEDFENRFETELTDFSVQKSPRSSDADFDYIATSVEQSPISLQEHVYRQIDLSFSEPSERFVAQAYTEILQPCGWITVKVGDISDKCGCTEEFADYILKKLQQFEPAGLFARNLRECLLIQAQDEDVLTDQFKVLLDNLDLLAKGQFETLQRKLKCDKETLLEQIKLLRSFNPKPGERFEQSFQQISAPDLMVKKLDGGWVVDLNRSNLPSIHINDQYAESIHSKGRNEEAAEYAAQAVASARWLKRAVAKRNSTTLKVGAEIIRRQTNFLEKGLDYLRPLSLKDIAEEVQMHESTISRVTSGLLINTPRGTFPLKSFFSISIDTDKPGIETSAAAVRNLIKNIISEEDTKKPFSDESLAEMISEKGVKLARRTVAKYRELMKIPSSSERRRRAKVFGDH
ncbi:MAG: RNA polymerase factor sigma-54 [Pseudomonadota bacterium]|nr:RNA polymerase factor sigma-54 [Pseudomonadota bacterium]